MNTFSSKNIVNASIDTQGNVIIGDGNVVINLKEVTQYKSLQASISILNIRFDQAKHRSNQYPNDESFKQDLLEIDAERSEKKRELDQLKQDVIRLAEDFSQIPINSERLIQAQQYLKQGDFKAARAVLDYDQMIVEQNALLERKFSLSDALNNIETKLSSNANEFLILARLTAINWV